MPFNGAGVYSPPGADFPAVTLTVISSTHFNNVINDIASGLTNCLTKDGQSTPTANIKLGGFKLTGVGAPATTNDALTFGTAGTMTTLTASTSVVTPVLDNSAGTLSLRASSNLVADVVASGNGGISPHTDNGNELGQASLRWKQLFTPILDSGTTGALSLKTNNGQEGFRVINAAGTAVNTIVVLPNTTGNLPIVGVLGTDTNISIRYVAAGTGGHTFQTGSSNSSIGSGGAVQFQVIDTASANRNVTITGSNGGNPTISTTGGNLAITPSVVIAGTIVTVGTNPSGQAGYNVPYTSGMTSRNGANSGDMSLIAAVTVNSVQDTVSLGPTTAGVIIRARSGGSAPTTSDIAPSTFCVWRDTGGATTKLYYNNGGSLQSVALA